MVSEGGERDTCGLELGSRFPRGGRFSFDFEYFLEGSGADMHEVRGRVSRKRDFQDAEENGSAATIPVI